MGRNVEILMGLDYGDRTVGVAISDALGLTAQGIGTIRREHENKLRRTFARIEELISEYGVTRIVVGFPIRLDSSEGERALKTREFAQKLEKRTGLPVLLWDERLSTAAAHRTLEEAGIDRRNRKEFLDKLAAVYILQGYLDRLAAERAGREDEHDQ